MQAKGTDYHHNSDGEDVDDGYDEEDDEDEDPLIPGHFRRAWAAWCVAEEVLNQYPAAYGPQSFGFIALGRMLKLIKAEKLAQQS